MSRYKVVINHEEQYSIWPADRENALGWNDVGRVGSKDDCIDHIEQVWNNLSPAELRSKITALRNI
jgi:MbtH protein